MNNGGDVLARGAKTAQFGGANSITDFENDVIYMEVAEVLTKYGLNQTEYDSYQAMRLDGQRLPDLTPVALQESMDVGFSITDHRKNYLNIEEEVKPAAEAVKTYPEPMYKRAQPILDRLLVMRISDDPDEELLEDGSTKNRKTGLITAAKYRQHSNVGIVLAAGKDVVLGGKLFDMLDFVMPGDKVTYGDYNSEIFPMDRKKVQNLCDELRVNYVDDPQGLRVVFLPDVRIVERREKSVTLLESLGGCSIAASELPTGCEVRNE